LRKILLATAFVLFTLHAHAANVSGIYKISEAANPEGGDAYTGEVAVDGRGKNVYYIDWKLDGSPAAYGVGLLVGDTLCVGRSPASGYGIVVYKVDGGHLKGDWITDGTAEFPGTENIDGPAGLNGSYQIVEGHGADNAPAYSGSVEIHPTGEVYNVTWTVGNGEVYQGVGLLKGDMFIVAWGTGAGVIYYDIGDNALSGHWANQGAQKAGVENLVRKE